MQVKHQVVRPQARNIDAGVETLERIIEVNLAKPERQMFEKSVAAVDGLIEACHRIFPALAK